MPIAEEFSLLDEKGVHLMGQCCAICLLQSSGLLQHLPGGIDAIKIACPQNKIQISDLLIMSMSANNTILFFLLDSQTCTQEEDNTCVTISNIPRQPVYKSDTIYSRKYSR
jgi:hypothetical protein